MTELVTRAQMILLARLLRVPVERIAYLEALGTDNLVALRERMSDIVFDENAETFRRISALVPVVPMSIMIPLAQKVVSPEMSGRSAGAISVAHPKKAVGAMSLLKPEYAASAMPYLDPRAVVQVAHLAPLEPIAAIAREVLRRKDYISAGLFVEAATPEIIRAVLDGVDDDEALMRSGSYVHSGKIISDILRVMIEISPPRISRLVTTTTQGEPDLQLAVLSVLSRIDHDLMETMGDVLFSESTPQDIESLTKNVVSEGAAAELLKFADHLSTTARETLAANPVTEDEEVLKGLVQAATERDELWPPLLRILAKHDPDVQTRLVEVWGAKLSESERSKVQGHISSLGLEDSLQPVISSL
jgi:hypothetical protein